MHHGLITHNKSQEEDDFEAQPTPTPQASPALRRLRKGPRPQVPLSSVPEGEVHHQSVARQVFPEATPTVNVSESEAKTAEDILAASADEEEEPRVEAERVATPPSHQDVVLEENVSDPPAPEVEVNNPEAATNITAEANDVVMAEANTVPEATAVPEVQAPETTAAPEVNGEHYKKIHFRDDTCLSQ